MARRRKGGKPVTVVKLNLSVDLQVYRRLGAYAHVTGRSMSDVCTEGVDLVMKGFRFSVPSPGAMAEDGTTPSSAGEGLPSHGPRAV